MELWAQMAMLSILRPNTFYEVAIQVAISAGSSVLGFILLYAYWFFATGRNRVFRGSRAMAGRMALDGYLLAELYDPVGR